MLPYIFCIVPIMGVCLFSHKRYQCNKKVIMLMLLPLALLIAFRGESVGNDTANYIDMYNSMNIGVEDFNLTYSRIEIGFRLLLRILSFITNNPQWLFVIQGGIFYLCYVQFLYKNKTDPSRFIIIFLGLNLFNFYLTGVRQSIAMSITLFSFHFIEDRKIYKFLATVILACTFHKSAIIFVFAYLFTNFKLNKKTIIADILVILLIVGFNKQIFAVGGGLFDIKYGIETAQNGYIMVLIIAFVTILSFIHYPRLVNKNEKCEVIIQMNALSMSVWVLRLFSRTAERVAMYFLPFTILLIVELLMLPEDKQSKQLLNLLTVLFFGAYFIYRLSGSGLLPYEFCCFGGI